MSSKTGNTGLFCLPCVNHGLIGFDIKNIKKERLEILFKAACQYLGVEERLILGNLRNRDLVEPRHMIMTYLNRERRFQTTTVGKYLRRNHATVIHAKTNVDNLCSTDIFFKQRYNQLKTHLNSL